MCFKVIMTSPRWHLNGINAFSANLARELLKRGIEAKILLTQTDRRKYYPGIEVPLTPGIPFEILPVRFKRNTYWKSHWRALKNYLEQESPCIYLPNYDFGHSSICPKLSERIQIVGVVHSDARAHYDAVIRLGRYWDAIVAVSRAIRDKVAGFDETFWKRLITIPYGVHVPETIPERPPDDNRPIRLVYAGRLIQYQKRILDIPKIMGLLKGKDVPFEFTIMGNGPHEKKLIDECRRTAGQNVVNFLGAVPYDRVPEILSGKDLFILTSKFEGTPVSLLEAMAQGCVPVVTDIHSGIPDLIKNNVNGYKVPVGDINTFAERIVTLKEDLNLRRQMSCQAYSKIKNCGYNIEDVAQKYIDLFKHVTEEAKSGNYRRPKGVIVPPRFLRVSPDILDSWSWRITSPIRWLGRLLRSLN